MTLKYALQEGFVTIAFGEEKPNGDQAMLLFSENEVKALITQDEDGNNFIVGTKNCHGMLPFEIDDARQIALTGELTQELFTKMPNGAFRKNY